MMALDVMLLFLAAVSTTLLIWTNFRWVREDLRHQLKKEKFLKEFG